MKDTECRKQIKDIKICLENESDRISSSANYLQQQITTLRTKSYKTETDVNLLNSQCGDSRVKEIDERVNRRLTQLQCRIIDLEDAVKEQKTISHGRDNNIEEALGEVSKAGMYNYFKLHNQIDDIRVAPGTLPKCFYKFNKSYKPNRKLEPADVVYPCYASSSELEKNEVIRKLKCLGTVYDFSDVIILNISPENLIKVNIHEYVASCNYRVYWIGINSNHESIQIDFRRNGE